MKLFKDQFRQQNLIYNDNPNKKREIEQLVQMERRNARRSMSAKKKEERARMQEENDIYSHSRPSSSNTNNSSRPTSPSNSIKNASRPTSAAMVRPKSAKSTLSPINNNSRYQEPPMDNQEKEDKRKTNIEIKNDSGEEYYYEDNENDNDAATNKTEDLLMQVYELEKKTKANGIMIHNLEQELKRVNHTSLTLEHDLRERDDGKSMLFICPKFNNLLTFISFVPVVIFF